MKKVNRWYFVLTQFALKFYTMARGTCWSQICDWALFKKSTVTELRKSSPLVQYTMAAVVRGSVPIQRCDTISVNTDKSLLGFSFPWKSSKRFATLFAKKRDSCTPQTADRQNVARLECVLRWSYEASNSNRNHTKMQSIFWIVIRSLLFQS